MDFKIKIKCPNCTSEVKPEYSAHILNGIRELSLVPESYSDDDELIYPQTGFSFEVQHYSSIQGLKE